MTSSNKLIPAPKARVQYLGEISAMTEWRWVKQGILPEPIKINGRNYRRKSDLLAFQERFSAESEEGTAA